MASRWRDVEKAERRHKREVDDALHPTPKPSWGHDRGDSIESDRNCGFGL
jgi:hypothetical protein